MSSRFAAGSFESCYLSVDGTDCRIYERYPFKCKWYSHKFKGPGLRYEVGMCMFRDEICWVTGPFPCGWFNDQSIFKGSLAKALRCGECFIAGK